MTFGTLIDIDDVFTPANFGGDRSRREGVARGQIMSIPIVLIGRSYNTQATSFECVIAYLYNGCLPWCNVVLTSLVVHSSVKDSCYGWASIYNVSPLIIFQFFIAAATAVRTLLAN